MERSKSRLYINFGTKEIHMIDDGGVIVQGFDHFEEERVFGKDKIKEFAILFRFTNVTLKSAVAIPEEKNEKPTPAKRKTKDGK